MARNRKEPPPPPRRSSFLLPLALFILLALGAAFLLLRTRQETPPSTSTVPAAATAARPADSVGIWTERALAVSRKFHEVYTPCWEGAYGAMGDARLFALTHDSTLLRFHLVDHPMPAMCAGTWVDDRAWVCLAELLWWDVTGRRFGYLVDDARRRYDEARAEGRLSSLEGFWSWYNWPPAARVNERIFTNSNMNQMATVGVRLYQATGIDGYLRDALLVWKGDRKIPGVVKALYRGGGRWEGKQGLAAFGKQLPWEGTEYCSLAAAIYEATGDTAALGILVATASRILDPATGWVDPQDFFQSRMDGNGAFVNYLLDAYAAAPARLPQIIPCIRKMLEHVWTNHDGRATVVLRRASDNGIRNGWNPSGGEDGYGVDEIGTVHAQGEAARAFGTFAYYASTSRDRQR